ncbi:carbohydrate ABC transporter permease [Paenibacillus contaminans]|uniref:Carbohydrate ABC transporter permease n=1 Tax=Paenibacillus contaminans TaxID=450362 RepID=A0A329MTI3_9BACL|nr:carbohydrate ABC transporter permease [Paenibacillus contaminans]RAV22912.1 carbohydrate ABC transporter permease [Paenibacillus contaminans]
MAVWLRRGMVSLVTWAGAILMLVPLVWMVSASFKPSADVFEFPIKWIPRNPTIDGYKVLFESRFNFLLFYWNTFVTAFMTILGVVVVGSMTAYAYAKIRFAGKNVIFLLLIATLAIPFQVVMIPQFIIFRNIGLLDTLTSQWIGAFLNPVMAIFLLRQYFMTLPDELVDSAKIDGCGHLQILWRIVMPISKPVLVTVILLYFVSAWNNYETALLYLRSVDKYVVSIAVRVFSGELSVNYSAVMAASVISIVPLIILLLFGQRYIISGITSGAVKG